MTREKAKEEVYYEGNGVIADKNRELVDKIYDDFESRTCENCKVGGYYCEIINALADTGKISLVNFGCNKFEAKDAN